MVVVLNYSSQNICVHTVSVQQKIMMEMSIYALPQIGKLNWFSVLQNLENLQNSDQAVRNLRFRREKC